MVPRWAAAVVVAASLGTTDAQGDPDICSKDIALCKNNPIEVIYTGEVCQCKCSNGWATPKDATGGEVPISTGKGCSECPEQFGGANCDECAKKYTGTVPNCDPCIMRVHCSDHADSLEGGSGQCGCNCRNHWDTEFGDQYECGHCPEEYDPNTDCKDCSQDRLDDAKCTMCSSHTHCNNHASKASPNAGRTACECTCNNHWEGDVCDLCPGGWDEMEDCNKCKPLYYGGDCSSKCDVNADCNNRAHIVVVKPDGSGCQCECDEEWNDGMDCRSCGPLAIKDGAGCKLCRGSIYCNNHAKAIKTIGNEDLYEADPTHTTCKCDCRNHWEDANCGTCPDEYEEVEADCDKCTETSYGEGGNCKKCSIDDCGGSDVATSCGSDSVSGSRKDPSQARLVCECKKGFESEGGAWKGHAGWYYGKCSKCTNEAVGNPPNCLLCSAATSISAPNTEDTPQCYGHETKVTANRARTSCICSCESGYEDDKGNAGQCDTCKEGYYRELPKPEAECKICSVNAHCSDHASRVTSNTDRSGCDCTCEAAWEGDDCGTCDLTKYEMGSAKPFCDKCKKGHINFPTCSKCEVSNECGGRANSVDTDPAQTKCVCDCFDQYEGDACDKCAEGYIEFPTCRQCTVQGDCVEANTESVTSSGDRSTCECTCKTGFAGPKCDECDEGHISYPTCEECTSAQHCSDRASGEHFDGTPAGVEADGSKTKCVCTCKNKYEGETCDVCPAEYEGDCDTCKNGGVYPTCGACTVAEHCNDHADKVEPAADNKGCVCTCTPPWKGEKCDQCESPWDPASDCKKCIPGYVPDGSQCRRCTITEDCNDQAEEVDSDGLTCECKRKDPDEYCTSINGAIERDGNGSCKCGNGQPGYTGVCPCGDVSIAPYYCWWYGRCNGMYSGHNCGWCDKRYNQSRGCGHCNSGYVNFPRCRECRADRDCGARAVAVESDEDGRYCRCSCQAGYRWEWGVGCYFCAPGYVDKRYKWRREYRGVAPMEQPLPVETRTPTPTMTPTVGLCDPYRCSVQDDCDGHAKSVTSDESSMHCICDCYENYESPHWYFNYGQISPAPHYSTQCDGCAPGYINYPDCTRCTNVEHCSGNAVNVTDDGTRYKCKCECYGQFTGDQCETCPPEYGGQYCDECAPGRVVYPNCIECTNKDHCFGHADNVTSNADNTDCVCTCRNQWTDIKNRCSECPTMYDRNEDCGKCANGGTGYPKCGAACDIKDSCSGKAYDVECEGPGCTGSGNFSCKCSCFEGFEPASCSGCLPGRDGTMCETCARGWEERDDGSCLECSNEVHCNGRAETVTSGRDRVTGKNKCFCSCKGYWSGDQCESCPDQYGGAEEEGRGGPCDKCATSGVQAYTGTAPNCQPCDRSKCVEENIEGMEVVNGKCQCMCAGAYEEENCGSCDPALYGPKCDRCASGLAMFPTCKKCNVEEDCFGYADAVEEDEGGVACNCKCDSPWCGSYGSCPVRSNRFEHNKRRIRGNYTPTPTETIACRGIVDAARGIFPRPGAGSETDTLTETLTLTLDPNANMRGAAPDEDEGGSAIAGVIIGLITCCTFLAAAVWKRRKDKQVASNLDDFEKQTGNAAKGNWRKSLQQEMIAEGEQERLAATEAEAVEAPPVKQQSQATMQDTVRTVNEDDDDERMEV
eukprot:Hpha_TRINITY_DN16052_c1_g5::TRINITY_DN16052_c1_g5_i1::g.119367::m.119367